MLIAFASQNQLGLNSELSANISQAEYITMVELEAGKLKKVTNVENLFFNQVVEPVAFAAFIKTTKAELFVVTTVKNIAITNELIKNNVLVEEGSSGRIAALLENFQKF
jgi:predicted Fe-Mo cluster-binding NifX family protein